MSAPRVLVTGASGFVGRHLCARLAAAGHPVRALLRGGEAPAATEAASVRGLDDREGLRRALAGVDAVIHLAARVHVMRDTAADPLAEFRRVNVEGTRAVAEEAARAGVRRVVLVSSVKAVGEGGDGPMTADTPCAPTDPYGVSKREGEEVLRGVAAAGGMEAVVVRLPLVYGPGMRGNMLSLFRLVDRGVPLPLGAVRNRRSVVFVENVAEGLRLAATAPAAAGGTFYGAEGPPLSTPDLVRAIAAALGRPARLVPVPPALFRAAGRLGDLLRLPLSSAAAGRLLGSLWVDGEPLWAAAGSRPPVSTADALAATAAWYRAR